MGVTGIILAGGKSARMGNEKGLMLLAGKPLISYAIEALQPICNNLFISTNNHEYKKFGIKLVEDQIKDIGPMGGIYSCLKVSENIYNLVLSCDMPLVSSAFLNYLLVNGEGFLAAVPWYGNNFFEPMCAYYHKNVVPFLQQNIDAQHYKLPEILKREEVNKLLFEKITENFDHHIFTNINTPDQLAEVEKLIFKK